MTLASAGNFKFSAAPPFPSFALKVKIRASPFRIIDNLVVLPPLERQAARSISQPPLEGSVSVMAPGPEKPMERTTTSGGGQAVRNSGVLKGKNTTLTPLADMISFIVRSPCVAVNRSSVAVSGMNINYQPPCSLYHTMTSLNVSSRNGDHYVPFEGFGVAASLVAKRHGCLPNRPTVHAAHSRHAQNRL